MGAAEQTRFDALLAPTSIALIGASEDATSLSGLPLHVLRQHGYGGAIYPVNPRHRQVGGLRCYASIGEVPGPVDLAVIAVRAALVPELVEQCAAAGARSAVVLSSGFAEESPDGAQAEAKLAAIAASSGMRILGPNAEGFFNVSRSIPVSFSPTVDFDRGLNRLIPGNVAIVSESGGLGFALFHSAQQAGFGTSYVVSTGNEADLDALEVATHLVEDAGTGVVALLVEGFRRPELLSPLARRAEQLGKALVVAKIGQSPSGRRGAAAHTAHDSEDHGELAAVCARYGVVAVADQDELLDVCFALSRHQPVPGHRVAVVTVSGGAGVWLADACEAVGLSVPLLSDELQQQLRPLMPSYGSAQNPVDATAQVVSREGVAAVLRVLCRCDEVDAVVVATSLAGPQMLQREEAAIAEVLAHTTKPVLIYSYTRPGDVSIDVVGRLGLPWYPSPVRSARALRCLLTGPDRPAGPGDQRPSAAARAKISASSAPESR